MHPRQHRYTFRLMLLLLVSMLTVVIACLFFTLTTQTAAASNHVDVMVLNTEIGPASSRFLKSAIATAESDRAQALVIEVDTPGGDLGSMKDMVEAELNSNVPIITYVSPTGGYAASAGAFVTLAAPIAAMAPTTRIGASSPITSTGGDIGSTLKAKLENDLVESMKGIQNRYHRKGVEPALKMVTNAASYNDTTAETEDIVDLGATNLSDLLHKVDGRAVTFASGRTDTLHMTDVSVQTIQPTLFDALYGFLLDPNVDFLLFVVAIIGIYLEISHPGAILPGTAGGIALLLFLFAIGSLSPNWTGLALMLLAFVLLVLDLRLPTHGVLTVGALIALVVGSLIFFNSGGPYGGPQVNPLIIYGVAGLIGIMSFTLITIVVRTQHLPITTGVEGMIGAKAVTLTPLLPEGWVSYGGERWSAVLDGPATALDSDADVQIVSVEGLRLHVQPVNAHFLIDSYSTPSHE
ncbi:MAG: nodulation protein NfeD [Ktedonobacteraceae bacterium]